MEIPGRPRRVTVIGHGAWTRFTKRVAFRTAIAITEWVCHCVVVGFLLIGIRLLEFLIEILWPEKKIAISIFSTVVSVDDVVATADLILLVCILTLGIYCVVKAYRGST